MLASFLALCGASIAHANDSTAELTTGGLVLAKTADIEMRSEDLAVSEKQINVRYVFFNHAARDVTTTVAFPMPDVAFDSPDTNVAIPEPESANFLDFRVTVDGREVQAQYEEKAVVDGTDISVRLKALGVPLAPQSEATTNALNALPPATQDELAKLKFVIVDEVDFGKGMQRDLTPIWTFKSTFYWSQTFPAGKEVVVEHRYTPSVGGTVGSFLNSTPIDPAQLRNYQALYCIDDDFLTGLKAALGKPDASGWAAHPFPSCGAYRFERHARASVEVSGLGPIQDQDMQILRRREIGVADFEQRRPDFLDAVGAEAHQRNRPRPCRR